LSLPPHLHGIQASVRLRNGLSLPKSAQRIGLTNGDEFPGNIVSLDDKILVLDTWYAGRISVPRSMLRRITPLSDSGPAVSPTFRPERHQRKFRPDHRPSRSAGKDHHRDPAAPIGSSREGNGNAEAGGDDAGPRSRPCK
jgi:hypothetical protein